MLAGLVSPLAQLLSGYIGQEAGGDLRSVKCQTVLQCLTSQGGPRAINIHIGQHRTEGKYDLSELVCQVVVVLSNVRDKYLVDA